MASLRLVGYVRVSRVAGREGESFISPSVQRERIEKTAAAQGHSIVEWSEDLDEPGSKYDRPGFQCALEMVERLEADGVIVAALDRFARSVPDAAVAMRRLEQAGGTLISVRDALDTSTPVGRFARTMMLALAELELERIRENWDVARRRAISRGVHISRVAPLGYRRRGDGKLEPDPETAPVVREVFAKRGGGASWDELCAFLDEQLPREDGGRWARSTITSIIRRRTYLGEARAGDLVKADAHDPLVTRAEWQAAQSTTGRLPSRMNGSLLQGIIRCGSCEHTMTRQSDGSRGYANYSCRKRHSDGVCPAPVGISVSSADAFAESAFLDWARGQRIVVSVSPRTDEIDDIVRRIDAAEAELVAYRDANLISVIGQEVYVAGLQERARTLNEAQQALASAQRSSALDDVGRFELVETWPTLDVRERRMILGAAIDAVVCRRSPRRGRGSRASERLTIRWRDDEPVT